ncbi:MAG: hypothetical protein Q8J74_00875 [Candidatus Didemnitutus sp.]|nr:hypothetical protein [Candidatus Didemnitutus sp.]
MPLAPDNISLSGPIALRALARAFSQFDDFDRFVAGLQSALDRSTGFEQLQVVLQREVGEAGEQFHAGTLALPLTGDAAVLGRLQVGANSERRQFGAEDLHLLAGLADFLSVALTQAQRLRDAGRSRELLRLLLNQAPVGIAAYGLDRRPIVANESALRWLGDAPVPFDELELGAESFHLRADGKLIYGEARRMTEVASGAWVIVLHDLTPEQAKLLDGMQREVYRSRAEKTPCSIALLEVADGRNGALRRISALRAALGPHELVGPYDAQRIGVVFATGGLNLRARLRKLRGFFDPAAGLRLGYAELGREGETPPELLLAALKRYGAFDPMLRPALLVHDDNAGVADTLAMVLGRDYRVVQSSSAAKTQELLNSESFEGFITEIETRSGPGGLEWVRQARKLQPGIRPFLTTINAAPHDVPPGEAVVIEKPFNVAALTALVRTTLAE